ncbi:hypothetical protein FFF34_010305 [Inquilinus sp. KBS0705]|nr:hypothetical protein FFF34_010305 [Inquilinus sp. KBS0705]
MKRHITLLKTSVVILLTAFTFVAKAQTAAPFNGPSDATTAPPTTAASVGQVLCSGSQITLKGPVDATGTIKYEWYKVNSAGVKTLVKGPATDNTYTETSAAAGYYTYYLVQINANDCTSDMSDPFQIYVLPALAPVIAGAGNVCEKGQTTTNLTITGLDTRFTYTYQWTREGVDIATGGTLDHYPVTEQTVGTYKYAVKVAYTLNAACTQTSADKSIVVVGVPTKPVIQFNN